MVNMDLNFGGDVKAASGEFTPVPEGTYFSRLIDIEVKATNPKDGVAQVTSDGTPARYLNVKWNIEKGEYAGRKLWSMHSVRFPFDPMDDTKKERTTREFFLAWLNEMSGVNYEGSTGSVDLKELYGETATIRVTHGEWKGKITENTSNIQACSESEWQEDDADDEAFSLI